jgi:hypothetical protein
MCDLYENFIILQVLGGRRFDNLALFRTFENCELNHDEFLCPVRGSLED